MAKHLTEDDIVKILEVLDGWQGRLTWEALCTSLLPIIGTRPTRQTLSSYVPLQEAFHHKKGRRANAVDTPIVPASLKLAAQRIKRLEEKIARLQNENQCLLEQFVIWQYNAYCHGLTDMQLAAPLPRVLRNSSEH